MQGSETDEGDKKVYKKADLGAKNTLYYNEEVGAHPLCGVQSTIRQLLWPTLTT
jgi:hypothetical protein